MKCIKIFAHNLPDFGTDAKSFRILTNCFAYLPNQSQYRNHVKNLQRKKNQLLKSKSMKTIVLIDSNEDNNY